MRSWCRHIVDQPASARALSPIRSEPSAASTPEIADRLGKWQACVAGAAYVVAFQLSQADEPMEALEQARSHCMPLEAGCSTELSGQAQGGCDLNLVELCKRTALARVPGRSVSVSDVVENSIFT
jgi:hypothetical protein